METSAVTSKSSIDLDSNQKMTMTGYSWTNPISSCGAITVVFASNGLTTTADLKLTQTGSTWFVEPTDYGTVKDHTFSLKL